MLFNNLLPSSCMLCKSNIQAGLGICEACMADLPWHKNYCPQCGLSSIDAQICGHCLKSPPDFDATKALFAYDFPIDRILQQYKYGNRLHLSKIFADLMCVKFELPPENALIVPMPLHPLRLKERGFNQSLEIARIISKISGLRLAYKQCQRIKLTPPQAGLKHKDRVRNVRSVFACNPLNGEEVVIVDDVMTTGASLNELAKTLKKAGASRVTCWVVARTL